jgi:hypothetical protein
MTWTASVSMHKAVMGLTVAGALFVAASPVRAGTPRYTLDPSGRTVVSLSNLSDAEDCYPAKLKGKVAKRTFDARGINLESLVIEEPNGSRSFINGNSNHGDDAATMGTVSAVSKPCSRSAAGSRSGSMPAVRPAGCRC